MQNEFHQWQDATNYRRDQTDKTPTAWEYKTPDLRIWISRHHIYNPGKWVITCFALRLDAQEMKIKEDATLEQAQEMALRIVRRRLQTMLSNLEPK